MQDDTKGFVKRLDRVLAEVKNFKKNQTIGGDSWFVYRASIDFPIAPGREYIIRFSPETSNDYVAVLKSTDPNRVVYGTIGEVFPDPNVKGKWYKPYTFNSSSTFPDTFFVYSTVKGTVSVEDVTGQDAGTTA